MALGRTPKRRVAIIGAAALASVGTLAAFGYATTNDGPAQEDTGALAADLEAAEGIFPPGWRPPLSAEAVLCVYADGTTLRAAASDFPLSEPLTSDRLIDECASKSDAASNARSQEVAVLCGDGAGQPVVHLNGECASQRSAAAVDVDELNRLRGVEVTMLNVATDRRVQADRAVRCPTAEEAQRWAAQVLADADLDIEVLTFDEGNACYRPIAYWAQADVIVQPFGIQAGT